jgi:hypothetical protein
MTDPPEHLADPARERLLDHPADRPDGYQNAARICMNLVAVLAVTSAAGVFAAILIWWWALP